MSHSVTTWMRLAIDLRARCAFNRLTLGVHIQGAAAERGGAVRSRHPGARTGSDGSDEAARSKQMFTTSVYGLIVSFAMQGVPDYPLRLIVSFA